MKISRSAKGFTLLEILIVLVVLGVVAGLMFPVLAVQVNRSKGQEAVTALGTVKEAAVRYYQTKGNSSYTGAALPIDGYDPGAAAAGQTPKFTYAFAVTDGGTKFSCTATLKAAEGGTANDWISIDEAGTVTKNGIFL